MRRYCKIFILTLCLASPLATFSQAKVDAEKSAPIEVVVNGETIQVSGIPSNGKVEIYSIIGSKVAILTVKDGTATEELNLTKGYYILKTANSAKKIAVK